MLWTGERAGYSPILIAMIMASSETAVEFAVSSATPRVFAAVEGTRALTSRRLAVFALRCYYCSNVLGAGLYSALCAATLLGVAFMSGLSGVVLLACAQTIQYPLINQLGDTAVEMALPSWILTFRGARVAFPGFAPLGAACGPLAAATTDAATLALLLNLMRFTVFAIFAMFYVVARGGAATRWALAVGLAIANAYLSRRLLSESPALLSGLVDEIDIDGGAGSGGKEARRGVPWPSKLHPAERSLLLFATCVFAVPEQAFQVLGAGIRRGIR